MPSNLSGYETVTSDILLTDRHQSQDSSAQPPSYDEAVKNNATDNMAQAQAQGVGANSSQWWNVKAWSKKAWIIVGVIIAIIIVIVVVVPVEVTEKNAYPSYTTLNYSLSETYSPDAL